MAPTYGVFDRRRFLQGTAFAGTAVTLAACGAGSTGSPAAAPTSGPPATPSPAASVTSPNPTPDRAATVLVKDVVEFELRGPYAWNGGSVTKAVLLTSQAELDERVAAGEIEIVKGTPDTDGQGFVVNCPSPVVAPNDFVVTTSPAVAP